MANYKYTLDISGVEFLSPDEAGEVIAQQIRSTFPSRWQDEGHEEYDSDLAELIEAFEWVTEEEELDERIDDLYSYCNIELSPSSDEKLKTRMAWVNI